VAELNSLIETAQRYAQEDPNPSTTTLIEQWITNAKAGDGAAIEDLRSRFGTTLEFGTAGLRGKMEPGTARMNRVMVMRASWGLGQVLKTTTQGTPKVVVGFDGRRQSRQFAEDTCAVLNGLGIEVCLFMDPVPTPLCAFALLHERANAAVMVTASHNPPDDNGYKVYWGNGAQIIPPIDSEIASAIQKAPLVSEMRRPTPPEAHKQGLRHMLSDSTAEAYLDEVLKRAFHPQASSNSDLRIVYTAMHGVGGRLVQRALHRAGFQGVTVVSAQADPDGHFPTVAFPNPEEDGALDLALATAKEVDAHVILANDPDADRLAVAYKDGDGYRMLNGNEIGVLLGVDALFATKGKVKNPLLVNSLVSSTWLGHIAKQEDVAHAETLTGFKWIANTAMQRLQDKGDNFIFGYEEAIGYTVGDLVRDKDGVSAALQFAQMCARLQNDHSDPIQELKRLAVKYGLVETLQWSKRLEGETGQLRIQQILADLRAAPLSQLGDEPVETVTDLKTGQSWVNGEAVEAPDLPASNVLIFQTKAHTRLIVRPSGTEPKIKFYLEKLGRATDASEVAQLQDDLTGEMKAIQSHLDRDLGL